MATPQSRVLKKCRAGAIGLHTVAAKSEMSDMYSCLTSSSNSEENCEEQDETRSLKESNSNL